MRTAVASRFRNTAAERPVLYNVGFRRRKRSRWAAAALWLVASPALAAQRDGPLEVKRPPPRPPRAEQPVPEPKRSPETPGDRPVILRRTAPPSQPRDSSPCPAGYVPKPGSDEVRPRLTRTPSGKTKTDTAAPAAETVECVYSETVVDENGRVVESRGGVAAIPLIEEARRNVEQFTEGLPDFLCTQLTSRYAGDSARGDWNLRDRIETDVLFLNGQEQYQNVRRNGKEVRRDPRRTGSWSLGEFGSLMQGLFHPATAAAFAWVRQEPRGGVPAQLYEYSVEQKNSRWKVDFEGELLYPAYKGAVWIDPESKRVLRIEMKAVEIPRTHSLDVLEMSIDYGPVRIGGQRYLLPARSENVACKRYGGCSRNEIEFRDYRKFAAESSVATVETEVSFEGEATAPAGEREPEKPEP